MKVLIVTVAGISSRFSQSIGRPNIKCLYHDGSIAESLLYRLLSQKVEFDRYIIVGGYRYEELKAVITDGFDEFKNKITLVENPHFADYGSGYSLFLGLQTAADAKADEIVFAEGDLFVDSGSYIKVCNSRNSVITYNTDPILADKAVAVYYDENETVHYVYDTGHKTLAINEPFLAVYNSGQVWKLADMEAARITFEELTDKEWEGTNLVFIEKYFQGIPKGKVEIIAFKRWINCNTVADFNRIRGMDNEDN